MTDLPNNQPDIACTLIASEALADLPVANDAQIKGGFDSLSASRTIDDTSKGLVRTGCGTLVLTSSNTM